MVQNDPSLAPRCPACQLPYRTNSCYSYPCNHFICSSCYSGAEQCPVCACHGTAEYSESWQSGEAAVAVGPVCESCEDIANSYCTTCPRALCDSCSFIHSRQRREHQVVPLAPDPAYPAESTSTRSGSSHEYPVNYDIPEHVYLPRKSGKSDSESSYGKRINSSADSHKRNKEPKKSKKNSEDNWNRTSECRKPFRKNPPVRVFNYSKSVSSRASSVNSLSDLSDVEKPTVKLDLVLRKNDSYGNISINSQRSEMSEKSVGTDLSGGASMISNKSYTIMVYPNLSGPSTPIPDKVVKTSTSRNTSKASKASTNGDPDILDLDDLETSEIEVDVDSGEYVKSSPVDPNYIPLIDDDDSLLLKAEPQNPRSIGSSALPFTQICFPANTNTDQSDDNSSHDHSHYIARRASSLSSGSVISYSSHTCDSHFNSHRSTISRSERSQGRPDGSLDGISDVFNTTNGHETDVSFVSEENSSVTSAKASRSSCSKHSACKSCKSTSSIESYKDDLRGDTLEELYKCIHGSGSDPRISKKSSKTSSSKSTRSRQSKASLGDPDKSCQPHSDEFSGDTSTSSYDMEFEGPSTSFITKDVSGNEAIEGMTVFSTSSLDDPDVNVVEVILEPVQNLPPGSTMDDKVAKLNAELIYKKEEDKELAVGNLIQKYNQKDSDTSSKSSIGSNNSNQANRFGYANDRAPSTSPRRYSELPLSGIPRKTSTTSSPSPKRRHSEIPRLMKGKPTQGNLPKANLSQSSNESFGSMPKRSASDSKISRELSKSLSASSKEGLRGSESPKPCIKRSQSSNLSQSSNESFGGPKRSPSDSKIPQRLSKSRSESSQEGVGSSESPKPANKRKSVNKLINKYNTSSDSFDRDFSDDKGESCMLPDRSSSSNSDNNYDLKAYITSEDPAYLTHSSVYDSDENMIKEEEESEGIESGFYDCSEQKVVLEHLSEVEETVESDVGLDAETISWLSEQSDVEVFEDMIEIKNAIPGMTMKDKVRKIIMPDSKDEIDDDGESDSIASRKSSISKVSDKSSVKSGRSYKNFKRASLTKAIKFHSSSSDSEQWDKQGHEDVPLIEKGNQKHVQCAPVDERKVETSFPTPCFDVIIDPCSDREQSSDVSSILSDDSYFKDLVINNELTDIEDENSPQSASNILYNRAMSGDNTRAGENLAFMDNVSEASLTPVSSVNNFEESEEVKEDDDEVKGGDVGPKLADISMTSSDLEHLQEEPLTTKTGKASGKPIKVVIGDEIRLELDDDYEDKDTMYFPTFADYKEWSINQERGCYTPSDSENETKELKRRYSSDSMSDKLREAMNLYIYDQDSPETDDNIKIAYLHSMLDYNRNDESDSYKIVDANRRQSELQLLIEDLPDNEITVDSGRYKGNNSPLSIDAVSLGEEHDLYSDSQSSGTMTPTEDAVGKIPVDRQRAELVNSGPPRGELQRGQSEMSIPESVISSTGASNHRLNAYVDEFNVLMQGNDSGFPDNSSSPISSNERYIDLSGEDTFTRKYSKRVSALAKKPDVKSQTLPRNVNSTKDASTGAQDQYPGSRTLPRDSRDNSTNIKTLPRKRNQSTDRLTGFLNKTYGGKMAHLKNKSQSTTNTLSSRSFGSIADYQKFGDGYMGDSLEHTSRTLPRHLGKKPQLRAPSMRQVDWSVMGKKGSDPGYLMNPAGITVDEGCVAICEEGNKRIQVFVDDQSEMCIEDLENPCGVALSPNNIFVTDIDANVVKVYTRDGEERGTIGMPGTQRGMFNEPRGIARSYNGDIAVCDTENHRVQIFNSECLFVKSIGIKGKETGQFREPIACSFDRWGRLLVSDHCNYRVQIFDNNYKYISDFGKYGKRSGEFWGVNGICSHGNGDVLVVDSDNNCLSVHSSDGRFISVFGRKGEERWEFLFPHSVCNDEFGNVYVSDWGNHRIHVMDKKLLPYLEYESHML